MKRRILQLLRRTYIEAALLVAGLAWAFTLARSELYLAAFTVVGLMTVAVGAGLLVLRRTGELAMAWNCPRLDATEMKLTSRTAPWETLRAVDAALAALEEKGGAYARFFPDARRHLITSAFRAIQSHALHARAREALVDAPEGTEGQRRLQAQAERAAADLAQLTAYLKELRLQLIAATAPMVVDDPSPHLVALARQSAALGDAVEEVQTNPGLTGTSGAPRIGVH